jgi:tRNA threonylcarbamoyladenosine biosynthesis protein TsaE
VQNFLIMADPLNNFLITPQNLSETAELLIKNFSDQRIFLFDAPMGAGKTTLIKEMCRSLGSNDNFSSPTYSIVNEYHYPRGKIFHFDLYRLINRVELLDIGFEDYLLSQHYCFIEWPQLAEELISEDFVRISISINNNNRYLSAAKNVPV